MPVILTADHIAKARGAFEPQRKNNYTVVIDKAGEVIRKALEKFPFPKESNDAIVVKFGNEERKVAGPAKFENVELVVKDYVDQPVMQKLIAWRKEVYDPATGKIGWAKDYKTDGELILSGPDGTTERKWKLQGIWPSALNPGGGDMESGEPNTASVTLTIDKAVPGQGF